MSGGEDTLEQRMLLIDELLVLYRDHLAKTSCKGSNCPACNIGSILIGWKFYKKMPKYTCLILKNF